MNIHPESIREFIERKRDNWDWIKRLSNAELSAELEALAFHPADGTKPLRTCQSACALLGIANPAFAFWLDMGLGKSRLALELIRYHIQQGEMKGALILAKSEPAVITWEDQIKQWKIDLPYVLLMKSMSSEDKWRELSEFDHGIIVGSYGGVTRMLTKEVRKQNKKGKLITKLEPDPKRLREMKALVQCLVPDEATVLSNADSLISRLFYQLRKSSRFCWELAGIPFGRDPSMMHRQLYLIDQGETLGDTLGLFRAAFFLKKKNHWTGFPDYKFDKSKEKLLHQIIKHRSITYGEEECPDLPKVVRSIERVKLPDEAKAYYARFVREIRKQYVSFKERKNSFIRMRQVSSGYVGFIDDATNEKSEIAFAHNPKLERLLELIDEIPAGRKFLIFHEFTPSGRLISAALKERKIDHEWIWGQTKDVRRIQDRFDHDPKLRGLVLNHFVGAYSLNLQAANYVFVFEAPVSPIDNRQMRKRAARPGQTRTVFEVDLVCTPTDERILEFHREGKSLFDGIIKNQSAAFEL